MTRTLRAWNDAIDETFFMGGVVKFDVLAAFKPHMFFGNQHDHCDRAASRVQTNRVPIQQLDELKKPSSLAMLAVSKSGQDITLEFLAQLVLQQLADGAYRQGSRPAMAS